MKTKTLARALLSFLVGGAVVFCSATFYGGPAFATGDLRISCLGFGGCWLVVTRHVDVADDLGMERGPDFYWMVLVMAAMALAVFAAAAVRNARSSGVP